MTGMTFKRACRIFGNGHEGLGKERIFTLAVMLDTARKKHPQFAQNAKDGCVVCGNEWVELAHAVRCESAYRQFCEALDVAATALRLAFGETADIRRLTQSRQLELTHGNNVRRMLDCRQDLERLALPAGQSAA